MKQNVFGAGFDKFVEKQIETREKVLGKQTEENLLVNLGKTPWIRLVSSINLTKGNLDLPGDSVLNIISNNLEKKPESIYGDYLAKNFILYGGVTDEKGNLKFGLSTGNFLQGLYGFGSLKDERGYVPMPGITDVNMTYKNNGALSETTIKIKAHSRLQFQIIDALFQRPGYSVLLEFGNTTYFDNNGKPTQAEFNTLPFNSFLNPNKNITYSSKEDSISEPILEEPNYPQPVEMEMGNSGLTDPVGTINNSFTYDKPPIERKYDTFTQEESPYSKINQLIEKEKENKFGNYEATLGLITKFNWKLNSNGDYDITINLVGTGNIIESLKLNSTVKNEEDIDETESTEINESKFHRDIYEITRFSDDKFEKIKEWLKLGETKFTNRFNPPCYITFGHLLKYLHSYIEPHGLEFDFNLKKPLEDKNFITTFPGNFSSNPKICLITLDKFDKKLLDFDKRFNSLYELIENTHIFRALKTRYSFQTEDRFLGRLINIYLNLDFILDTFESSKNQNNDVVLIDFLNNILKGINNSLGNLNSFRITVDNNKIKIFDESPLPSKENSYTKINTFGLENGRGSFVRNFSLNAELNENFTTMVSIGARSNGNMPLYNATTFSIYNKGLEDRIRGNIKSPESRDGSDLSSEAEYLNKVFKSKKAFTALATIYGLNTFNPTFWVLLFKANPKEREQNPNFNDDSISLLSNFNKELSSFLTGFLTQKQERMPSSFIPFNLSLNMDGISGVKLFQTFQVDGKVLPLNYNPKNISLLIQNLSHEVTPSLWTTTIETLSRPLYDPQPTTDNTDIINTPTSEPDSIPEPFEGLIPPPTEDTEERREAIENSRYYVFEEFGERDDYCARWVYNIANNYKKYLNNPSYQPPKEMIKYKGHANTMGFYIELEKLGYTRTQLLRAQSKEKIQDTINKISPNYGDIVCYQALDKSVQHSSHTAYGHTQIYTDLGWASSKVDNYGKPFVYESRPNNIWNLVLFKA